MTSTPGAPVDRAGGVPAGPVAVGFGTALRRAGIPVTADRLAVLTRALLLVPPVDRGALYWTCRVTLLADHTTQPLFDAVFAAVFDGMLDPADSRGDPNAPPSVGAEPRSGPTPPDGRPTAPGPPGGDGSPAPGGSGDRPDGPPRPVPVLASAADRLQHTAFADLEPAELAEVRRLVAQVVLRTPDRRGSRWVARGHGPQRLDLRRTVRAARSTGGEPFRLVRRQRRPRPRRLVLLCDVSASMRPCTRVYLSLLAGAVAGAGAEAFVFATSTTRLTRALRAGRLDLALSRATEASTQFGGGTRLAGSLQQFLTEHGRRGTARGAVVVILSDGWSTDDPADVGTAMARLHRLAHRVVWVNPRAAAPGFLPRVGGMAAALPWVDAFLSGHSLAALHEVAEAIADDRPRR